MASKNLGQVEGLYIGPSAPTNNTLIWYDTSSHVHKVYDTSLSAWTVLSPTVITDITYSALVSRAGGVGLTQGQWFRISDLSDALALAITGTKIQYVNNNGVSVIDDLGTHVVYNVSTENLLIDDILGVYDVATNKLAFSFSETTPVMNTGDTDIDYVYGLQKRGNVKTQRKFRLSSFLSAVTGNDISWNGGFFLNFYNKLRSYFNVSGGVATHEALEQYKTLNNQAIQQIGTNTQQAIEQVGQNIQSATTNQEIYGKQLPAEPTSGTPLDIHQNDTLSAIVNKIQRWITSFKRADGIKVTSDFAPAASRTAINNSDTVDSALRKVQKNLDSMFGDGIFVSDSPFSALENDPLPIDQYDTILDALLKLYYWVNHIDENMILNGEIRRWKLYYDVLPNSYSLFDFCFSYSGSFPSATFGDIITAAKKGNAFGFGISFSPTVKHVTNNVQTPYWDGAPFASDEISSGGARVDAVDEITFLRSRKLSSDIEEAPYLFIPIRNVFCSAPSTISINESMGTTLADVIHEESFPFVQVKRDDVQSSLYMTIMLSISSEIMASIGSSPTVLGFKVKGQDSEGIITSSNTDLNLNINTSSFYTYGSGRAAVICITLDLTNKLGSYFKSLGNFTLGLNLSR